MDPTSSTPYEPKQREVLVYPNSKLYEKSAYVDFEAPNHFEAPWGQTSRDALAGDLVKTMTALKAAGISAIQVGVPVRIMAIIANDDKPLVMVNPHWTFSTPDEEVLMDEGCLSFPGIIEKVFRYAEVEAAWLDLDGERHTRVFFGVPAQTIQHEVEHLEGRLFIEHMSSVTRDRVRMKLKKGQRAVRKFQKMLRDPKALARLRRGK